MSRNGIRRRRDSDPTGSRERVAADLAAARRRVRSLEEELERRDRAPGADSSLAEAKERAERKAQELNTLLQSIADGVVLFDPDGRILQMNGVAAALLGLSEEQERLPYAERTALLEVRGEDGHLLRGEEVPSMRALRGGAVHSFPMQIRNVRDGRLVWLLTSAAPLRHPDGRPAGAIVSLSDISELKRLEQALLRSKEEAESRAGELEAALESIADGVLIYDRGGRILRMNRIAEEIYGYTPEERRMTIGERVARMQFRKPEGRLVLPEQTVAWRAVFLGRVVRQEMAFFRDRRTGRTRWITSSAVPLRTAGGEPAGAVLTLTDITARKRLEGQRERLLAQLAADRARLQAVIDNAPEGIVVADSQGRVLLGNPAADRIFGRSFPVGEGYPSHERMRICLPDGSPCPARQLPLTRSALDGLTLQQAPLLVRRPDGESRHLIANSAPILAEDGRPAGAVGLFQDITPLKDLEEELRQAKEAAENASRAKSEFLAHMSHEIRTPLSAVVGLAEVLRLRLRGEENGQLIGLLQESARSLLAVVGDILDFSRIEAGRVEVRLQELEPRALVAAVAGPLRAAAEQKGLSLTVEAGEDVPASLVTDGKLLSQVLRNLLSNAVKYTERGGVAVRMEAAPRPGGAGRLRVEVADSGAGIPAGKQGRLFQSFSRLHDDVRLPALEGTGLGLAISRKLVELLGGEIGVESEPGAGSTFWFTLPLEAAEPEGAARAGAGREEGGASPLAALPPLEVLVVEDDAANRVFLQAAFRDGGHRVTLAAGGAEAVEEAERRRLDLVLMDIQLPGMDGIAAARRIRALPGEASGVPIIAVTAFTRREDAELARQAGMDGYVSKPVDLERLASEIRRARADRGRGTPPGRKG